MDQPNTQNSPPVLAGSMFVAGLASALASVWLSRFDLAGFVEQRITRASGGISGETDAWLRNTNFAGALLIAGLALAGLGVLYFLSRKSFLRSFQRLAAIDPPGSRVLAAIACAAVLLYYLPTLGSGYFRYDDFDFLSVAQSKTLWDAIWLPHGDHVYLLTRAAAFVGYHIFGVATWPWNLWLLLTFCGALVAGLLLLGELGVSRPARLVFVVLVIFWSPWAEMMSGYYLLNPYMVIAALSLCAAWCYLRWRRKGGKLEAFGIAASCLLAPLIDVSGVYVFGVCGVFLACDFAAGATNGGLRSWLRQHRSLLTGLAFAVAVSGCVLIYAYRVAHPGTFLSMAHEHARTGPQFVRDLAYLFDVGVLLSMVTPFVYARIPAAVLGTLATMVFVVWLVILIFAFRSAGKPRRLAMVAMLMTILGVCLMVNLGRPPAETWIVRWAAKHVCPAYIWSCVLLAACWDTLWLKVTEARRLLVGEITVTVLALFLAAQTAFGLLGMAVSFPPFGYPAGIRDAVRRRSAVEALSRQVADRMATLPGDSAVVPTLDGKFINAAYPSLFIYNLSIYRPFFSDSAAGLDFVRNPAMQSWDTSSVRTVPVLRDAVSPDFIRLLAEDPVLKAFYFESVSMVATSKQMEVQTTGGTTFESNGSTPIVVREQPWDPEKAPRLQIEVRTAANSHPEGITVNVVFWSELAKSDWAGSFVLQSQPGVITEVDLRQVYAFSLSNHVSNLRVMPEMPGTYWIRLATAEE